MLAGLVFVTSSVDKHREAQAILAFPLERVVLDLDEVQGLDVVAITRAKARAAFLELGRPVLVEDTSLELEALGGFPGPLVRWVEKAAGVVALARMIDSYPSRSAVARCAALAFDGEQEWLGVGEVRGTIAREPRGSNGFGWDVVFEPEWGGGRTYAEMPPEEKNAGSHRAKALNALAQSLGSGRT